MLLFTKLQDTSYVLPLARMSTQIAFNLTTLHYFDSFHAAVVLQA